MNMDFVKSLFYSIKNVSVLISISVPCSSYIIVRNNILKLL